MLLRLSLVIATVAIGGALSVGQPPGHCAPSVDLSYNQVVAVPTTQVILIPSYFAAYTPVPPATEPEKTDDVQRQILAELKAMNRKLDLLLDPGPAAGGPRTPLPGPKSDVDPVAATVSRVIGTSCVKCHAAAVSEEKGGGFVMVGADNKTPQFSPQELRRIRARVADGSMPKGPTKLTNEEKLAMTTFFAK